VVWTSLGPLQAERQNLERAMLLGIPLSVGLAVAAGLGIGRRALRPLEAMVRQTAAIDGRSPSARLTGFNPHDELGTLGRGFNALLDRLAASLQQQRVFMADASHQLRTPVSVVRTSAQVMLTREGRSEEEYRDSLDVIARQARKLTRMVDDMFTLALADADALPLQPAPLYLDELVDEATEDVRMLAVAKDIRLSTELAGETPFLGDEHLLRQMLTNLLENAIRHTPPLGTVTVSLTRSPDGVRLVVADAGSGIDSADAERVFDRFVRLDAAGREAGGGLGLPIARWIAESHGGTLVLVTTGPQGSRFEISLPQSPTA
jgi:signal transduction histidine kinase